MAESLVTLAERDLPEQLYRAFPDWDEQDPALCSSFFGVISSLGVTLELLGAARRALPADPT